MEAVCGHVNALSVREVSYASFADPRGVHSRVTYRAEQTVLRGCYHNMVLPLPVIEGSQNEIGTGMATSITSISIDASMSALLYKNTVKGFAFFSPERHGCNTRKKRRRLRG